MKPKETLIVNINVDWRMLALFLMIGVLLVAAYGGVIAQSNPQPTINDPQADPAMSQPEPDPVIMPSPPASGADDVVYTINGEWIPRDSVGTAAATSSDASGMAAEGTGSAHFYLTAADYNPDEALAACASGYHMASLWEMLDVSNLTYDTDHPDAYTQDDGGSGPPSGWNGWVRTGRNNSGSNSAGSGNCLTWTSTDSSYYGTAVRLSAAWESAPGEIGTWDAGAYQCSLSGPVWCAQD